MRNRALRTAGIVLMFFSAGFICYRFSKFDLSSIEIDIGFSSVMLLVIALIVQTLSVLALGAMFLRNVGKGKDGQKIPVKEAVLVYCRANLGKYIPGNVFQYVERNIFFSSYGISHVDTVMASLLEVTGLVVGAFIISVSFGNFEVIGEAVRQYGYVIPVICVFLVIAVIAAIIFVRKKKKSLIGIIIRVKERGGVKLLLLDVLGYTVILLVMGAVALLAYCAMTSSAQAGPDLVSLPGAYIAAWLCGFIIIGAPGGIGVREAVFSLIYINTPYLDEVLALSILIRVISVIADILAFVAALILCGSKRSKKI